MGVMQCSDVDLIAAVLVQWTPKCENMRRQIVGTTASFDPFVYAVSTLASFSFDTSYF